MAHLIQYPDGTCWWSDDPTRPGLAPGEGVPSAEFISLQEATRAAIAASKLAGLPSVLDYISRLEQQGDALAAAVDAAMTTHPGGIQITDAQHRITLSYEEWYAIAHAVHAWRLARGVDSTPH
jgi:hypothetical protein